MPNGKWGIAKFSSPGPKTKTMTCKNDKRMKSVIQRFVNGCVLCIYYFYVVAFNDALPESKNFAMATWGCFLDMKSSTSFRNLTSLATFFSYQGFVNIDVMFCHVLCHASIALFRWLRNVMWILFFVVVCVFVIEMNTSMKWLRNKMLGWYGEDSGFSSCFVTFLLWLFLCWAKRVQQ